MKEQEIKVMGFMGAEENKDEAVRVEVEKVGLKQRFKDCSKTKKAAIIIGGVVIAAATGYGLTKLISKPDAVSELAEAAIEAGADTVVNF